MADSDSRSAGVALALGQGVTLWTVLLPPLTDVRRHTPGRSPDFADDVRHAELVAGTLAITIGGVMGYMNRSYAPIVASSIVISVMILAYEYTLQSQGTHANVSVIPGEASSERYAE